MSEKKAIFVSLMTMTLLGGMLLCFRIFQPPIYYILVQIFAVFGLAVLGFWFFCWLQFDGQPFQEAGYTNLEPVPQGPKSMFDQDNCTEPFNDFTVASDSSECDTVDQ